MNLPVNVFNVGSVIDVFFPFREDKTKGKVRPAVVFSFNSEVTYVVKIATVLVS